MSSAHRICIALLLCVFSSGYDAVSAQASDDLAATVAAAKGMLKRHSGLPLKLNPMLMMARQAPPDLASQQPRLGALSTALSTSLNATLDEVDAVLLCPAGPRTCRLNGASVYLSMSNPTILGDTASVTVTALFNSGSKRQPVGYETVEFTLLRSGRIWKVLKQVQLGIS